MPGTDVPGAVVCGSDRHSLTVRASYSFGDQTTDELGIPALRVPDGVVRSVKCVSFIGRNDSTYCVQHIMSGTDFS
jgi:hypothetical protein